MKWFRKAADQGDASAQINLGNMYAKGHGVPQDYAEAGKWYRKAADQGGTDAQYRLGVHYSNQRDYAEVARWYRKATQQGNVYAQSNLTTIYAAFPAVRDRLDGQEPKRIAAETKIAANVAPPASEKLLIAAVEKARAAYTAGANEMAQGAARPARAKEICAAFKDLRVSKWIGEVETLSSNTDGLGVLSVQIAKGILIKTWNNAISDVGDKTLIDPESTIFKQAVALKKGQKVTFGGHFFRNPTDCVREAASR